MKKENIKIKGYRGTWSVIDETIYMHKKVFLLEHEYYGDMTQSLIVDEKLNVILDDVWNGFDELKY